MSRADDLALLATCLETRMSPESIAMVLGRSVKWVLKESAALAEAEAAHQAVIEEVLAQPVDPAAKAKVEAIIAGEIQPEPGSWDDGALRQHRAIEARSQPAPEPKPATPKSVTPKPYRTPTRRPRGASVGPRFERLALRLKGVSNRVARWAWWFVAAGWEVGEVADLFDVDVNELDRRVAALDGGMG